MSQQDQIPRPNATHLRDAIDSGRGGDKAPGHDPAAAPLGTDEEAGGAGPSSAEVAQALKAETRTGPGERPNAVEPDMTPDGHSDIPLGVKVGAAVVTVLAVIAAFVLFGLR